MSDDIFDGPLPKGMSLPASMQVEQMPEVVPVTSSDVNYAKLVRDALEGVEDVVLVIGALSTSEEVGAHPVVQVEVVVMPKGTS